MDSKLRACMQQDEESGPVVSEALLYERLARPPFSVDRETASGLIAEAMIANELRWVAFQGFALGGRPD